MIKNTILLLILVAQCVRINPIFLSCDDAQKIGILIWNNEARLQDDLLVFWHEHESFPSLGIGHYIWYPQGYTAPYIQQFPLMCDYLKAHGVPLLPWLEEAQKKGAPWKSRDEFLQDIQRTAELRILLKSTIDLQTTFMVARLEEQWPLILQEAEPHQQEKLVYIFNRMRSSFLGTYALIDYLNFKGTGIHPQEEINGQRWGLLQVLLDMPENVTSENVNQAFTASAAHILVRLIKSSAPDYKNIKFLANWMKRISTYLSPVV